MEKKVKVTKLEPSTVRQTDKHTISVSPKAKVLVAVLDLAGNEASTFETSQRQFDKSYAQYPNKYQVKKN